MRTECQKLTCKTRNKFLSLLLSTREARFQLARSLPFGAIDEGGRQVLPDDSGGCNSLKSGGQTFSEPSPCGQEESVHIGEGQ